LYLYIITILNIDNIWWIIIIIQNNQINKIYFLFDVRGVDD